MVQVKLTLCQCRREIFTNLCYLKNFTFDPKMVPVAPSATQSTTAILKFVMSRVLEITFIIYVFQTRRLFTQKFVTTKVTSAKVCQL